jgi:hypothetical protein
MQIEGRQDTSWVFAGWEGRLEILYLGYMQGGRQASYTLVFAGWGSRLDTPWICSGWEGGRVG